MAGYRIYYKPVGRKRFAPLGEDADGNFGMVANLLCASVYTVNTAEEKEKLETYVENLKALNPGAKAELRPVKGW